MKWPWQKQHDEELASEIESYIEHEIDEQIATGKGRGASREQLRYTARRKLGNRTLIQEEVYRMNSLEIVQTLWQDFRHAVRLLRKSPGFTTVAVLSLALGIGANTAMFSVVNTVLLRSLPCPRPDQLVRAGRQEGQGDASIPEYEFWKQHSRLFASLAGYRGGGERRLVSGSGDEWISTLTVTADFIRTLRTPLSLGREFNLTETQPGGPQAIILSDSLWRRRFGADPAVLGRGITLDETIYTVVGVLPAAFWFPRSGDALVPLRPSGTITDTGTNTELVARLKDGVTLQQAQAEMAIVSEDFRRAYATRIDSEYRGLTVISYQDWLTGNVRSNLLALFGATGLLLLIACSNLAALLLTRFAARRKELAVRLALGSSRSRLVAQFFMENLLLAALGASAGLFTAYGLLKGLVAWMPFDLPAANHVQLDASVLAFTVAAGMATALAFTLVPLLSAARLNVQEALNSAGRSTSGSVRAGARNMLVIGEVALATALLIAAGLLIQSLNHMYQERLGFAPQGLITFETPFDRERQRNISGRTNFTSALLERLQALPGAKTVAATNVLPLVGQDNFPSQREGRPDQSIGGMEIRLVTPAYFELMQIPVRQGRSFGNKDVSTYPPVAMVNETLAKTWWPNGNPLSSRVVIGLFRGRAIAKDPPREVIGVAGDTKTNLKNPPRPTIFVPMAQTDNLQVSELSWVVKSTSTAGLADELRRTIAGIDPGQRIRRLRSMEEIVASTTASPRFNASLFGIFAGIALALAAIGVYGLLSFLVAQRRHEIGTRMALGATSQDVLKLFFKQGLTLTAIGLSLGLVSAYFLTRALASLLYGVKASDFFTYAIAALVLLLAALTATYLPARRAAKTNPVEALRFE